MSTTTTTTAKGNKVNVVLELIERHFDGTKAGSLSESETNALNSLTERHAKSVAAVFVQPTHRLGPHDTLQGATFALRLDAPAPRGLFSDRWDEQLLVSKVVGSERASIDVAALTTGINKVGARLASVNVADTYDPLQHMYDPDSRELREPHRWTETLGSSSGRFVGAFQRDMPTSQPEYYLAVRAGLDESAGRHIDELLQDHGDEMTLDALVKHPLYIQYTSAAERNAERVLAKTARACGVRVLFADDIYAHTGRNEAPPERGMPNVRMVSNTLRAVPTKDGAMNKYMAYYSRTSPVAADAQLVAVPTDPLTGIRLLPLDNNKRPLGSNVHIEGVPFGVEHADAVATHADHVQSIRSRLASHEGTRAFVGERVTWSGRSAQRHDDNPLLWRYAPYTARHDALLAEELGNEAVNRQVVLKPLRVWIANSGA